MFKRPSTRSRAHNKPIELNLIPMMDALVVIISFLMSTMAFVVLVEIVSPIPIISETKDIDKKPLQLTLSMRESDVLIWSPFQVIKDVEVTNTPEGTPDIDKIHQELVNIKMRFKEETQIVLVPAKNVPYDILVELIDSVRAFLPIDDKIYIKDESTGQEKVDERLFPEITFGNLLE